jgi:hypothetical protein
MAGTRAVGRFAAGLAKAVGEREASAGFDLGRAAVCVGPRAAAEFAQAAVEVLPAAGAGDAGTRAADLGRRAVVVGLAALHTRARLQVAIDPKDGGAVAVARATGQPAGALAAAKAFGAVTVGSAALTAVSRVVAHLVRSTASLLTALTAGPAKRVADRPGRAVAVRTAQREAQARVVVALGAEPCRRAVVWAVAAWCCAAFRPVVGQAGSCTVGAHARGTTAPTAVKSADLPVTEGGAQVGLAAGRLFSALAGLGAGGTQGPSSSADAGPAVASAVKATGCSIAAGAMEILFAVATWLATALGAD